jgi:hypothetical protein
MKFNTGKNTTGWLRSVLRDIVRPDQAEAASALRIGQMTRQGLAITLSALMIMIPMGQADAFAQDAPAPGAAQAPADTAPGAPQAQPLAPDQLDQLVAPIALYPDALVAQVLAASTYPTEVVEADRWVQTQGNAPAATVAAGVDSHSWDPSVKALTAFPTVLAQMDKNLQWTTDLGNAYYNQPQDVMDAVQTMRQKAQGAGHLRSTEQLAVGTSDGAITIAPSNPSVVYVPVYDPWAVYGAPFPMYPGYFWATPPGIFWGGFGLGFGVGIGIGLWGGWGWGWGHWGMGWHNHSIFYNRGNYFTHSSTVVNRGFNRAGGPGRGMGARGAYARSGGGMNRAGAGRPGMSNRGPGGAGRPGGNVGHSGGNFSRPGGAGGHQPGAANRPGGGAGAGARSGGGHATGGGHAMGGGGGHSGGGGHGGHR